MFHRSEKAIRYAKALDEARLHGQAHLIPNLARKLIKHDHEKQCVAKTAVCEKTLNDLVAPLEKNQRELVLQVDGPAQMMLPPEIRPENMQDIVKEMEEAIASPGTVEDKQLAEVIHSQMWITMGQYRKVIDKTGHFVSGEWKIDCQGYAHVLVIKAYAYHGIAWEGLDKIDIALETYAKASDYIHTSQPPTHYYSVQYWISKVMYRLCMLSLRLEDPANSLPHFRRYKFFVDTAFKESMGVRERLAVYYWYWRTLSDMVKERIDMETKQSTEDIGSRVEFFELKNELWEMQSHYESVLYDTSKFPRAGSTNNRILEFIDLAMQNWRLLGSDPIEAKALVQALYRASTKTFLSTRVLRHLMFALEGSGNYIESERALDAVINIFENEKKTLARMAKSSNPVADEGVVQDIDSDDDILRTMAAGVRILVKFLGKGKKAMEMAQKMERDAKEWGVTNEEVLGSVYHSIGIANSLWSMQTIEADTRQSIQTTAITAYTTAITYTPHSLPTFFQLALQHAWQRNLEKSIAALSQALHIDKFHIPSIHLLTLVLTALEDYEKALQTCHTIKFDHLSDLSLDDSAALMEMQLTYLRIVEVVSGRDLALEVQKGVFKLYYRLFGPVVRAGNTEHGNEVTAKESGSGPEPPPAPVAPSSGSPLSRTRSNLVPDNRDLGVLKHQLSESVDGKPSLQVPLKQPLKHQRSFLRRKHRSHPTDAHSISTASSIETPETRPDSSYSDVSRGPAHTMPESTLPPPIRRSADLKTPALAQRLSNHALEPLSKYTLTPQQRRDQVAKLYRAKLWLACAGIYRRGRQWEGAQAAIQDALLCDSCPEDVFTELGHLHLDRGSHTEAIVNFERALLQSPDYPPAVIGLARTLLTLPPNNKNESTSGRDRAEVLLDSVTKLAGWDSSEAWFWLGEIYEQCCMPDKAAECWTYCEELEERKPIREWRFVKPEWI